MHSLKASCVGQVLALAKPHDSVGKRTRNRIPKEERKTLVESFIKKHQSLNNGSFPSLNLTHKEVGGSFYTIREIVREIIQENRVLGTSGLILEGKGDDDHLEDQTLSSSLLMDPVPPLSLSPEGFHSLSGQSHNLSSEVGETMSADDFNGRQAASEETGSDVLKDREVNGCHQLSEEGIGLLTHEPVGSTDIPRAQFTGSCGEENDAKHGRVQTICESFVPKPQGEEVEVDKEDIAFGETPLIESKDTKPVNNDDEAAMMTERVNMRENTLVTIGLPAEAVVAEAFPVTSVTSTTMELANGTEAKVESDSSVETSVDLGDISSSTSAVPEERGTQVIGSQMPNQISIVMEKKVEEKTVNPASVDAECADTKGKVVDNAVISSSIHETKEFSNGSCLTTERTIPKSSTESGSLKEDIARNEVTSVEKARVEKENLNASDSSSSQKGNIAPLNRIKPESWKGQSNVTGGGRETNPLLAVLKSFLTAFVKFWSE